MSRRASSGPRSAAGGGGGGGGRGGGGEWAGEVWLEFGRVLFRSRHRLWVAGAGDARRRGRSRRCRGAPRQAPGRRRGGAGGGGGGGGGGSGRGKCGWSSDVCSSDLGIALGWPELATLVGEGDRVDVAARLVSRRFGGV